MKYYFLIVIWLVVVAGCASSARKTQNLPKELPVDVNSSDKADFDEFEKELSSEQAAVPDPIEPWNRAMFGINDRFYFWVAKPVLTTYKNIMPQPARVCTGNFFENITTPARLVNCLLQGKGQEADMELRRFGINTTVGVLGLGDPARDQYGVEPADEDLGQTLAVYGLGDGFYVVWPVLGPSTLRDTTGMVGDQFMNPVRYVKPKEVSIGISVFGAVNKRSFHIGEYEALKSAAVDPYVAMRDAYGQYRNAQIKK
jgi:phospholipid-binding lipoprotein MlaA